jgi:uncharacterized membrane protein
MPSKYDTNPLDPEFPEKAKARAAATEAEQETVTLPYRGGETRQFPPETAPTDERETRRFAEADVSAYSSTYAPPYTGQYLPNQYQTHYFVSADRSHRRRVKSLGLPENIVIAAAYFPFYIGLVAAFIELLLVPKSEPKVRFHAAQGLAAHLGILAIVVLLGVVTGITGGDLGSFLFNAAAFITLIVFTIKALRGRPIHIAAVEDLTNWLEEKLRPMR